MRPLERLLSTTAKRWIKEKGASLLKIPWNRFDFPISLMPYLRSREPINLVDVGASQGDFTFSVDKYCGVRRAILVEPQPKRVLQLRSRFSDPRYTVVCGGAAADNGTVEMELLNWDYSSSLLPLKRDMLGAYEGLDMNVREVISVCTSPLDNICAEFLEDIDLLKVDVQGAEKQVIAGASETLKRVRMIWMEVSFRPLYEGSETLEGMIEICGRQGFVLTRLEEGWRSAANGELLQADALFMRKE